MVQLFQIVPKLFQIKSLTDSLISVEYLLALTQDEC